jgi:diadenosine tetraphosphate (Ap4A) HIT family hydrolase
MEEEVVFESKYWIIKHRSDSRYVGYLIALCKEPVLHMCELSSQALSEMSIILAQAEKLLIKAFNPYRVVTFKMGFAKGVNCHFNLIPISSDLLAEIEEKKSCTHTKPDGQDAILYVARKYCERDLTIPEYDILLSTVKTLRDIHKSIQTEG